MASRIGLYRFGQALQSTDQSISLAAYSEITGQIPEFDVAFLHEPEITPGATVVRGDGERAGAGDGHRHFEDNGLIGIERQTAGAGPAERSREIDVECRSEEHTSELQSRFGISYAV